MKRHQTLRVARGAPGGLGTALLGQVSVPAAQVQESGRGRPLHQSFSSAAAGSPFQSSVPRRIAAAIEK